jgi:uncharacterized protein (TIGR03435 family)
MKRLLVVAWLVVTAVAVDRGAPLLARPQNTAAPATSFEIASVKKSAPPGSGPTMIRVGARQGERWLADNATLRALIRSAYAPRYQMEGQIVGGPGWLDTDRFDIVGTMRASTSADEMRAMVQALLADRFKLVVHTETRELPVYALVLARADGRLGPAMRPTVDCDALRAAQQKGEAPTPPRAQGATGQCRTAMMFGPTSRLESGGVTTAQLVSNLSQSTGRPVLDRTGLNGFYELKLEFAAEPGAMTAFGPAGAPASAAPVDAPSLFSAIQDQLGLKLEPRREPMDVLVIERAEQPTEN